MEHDDRTRTDLLDSMDQVLTEAVPSAPTRRALMARAGGLLAAGTALTVPGVATAAQGGRGVLDVLTTFEHFGVTLLTAAVRKAPGTPSEMFLPVLRAANTTEFHHIQPLQELGGRPMTKRFWIPDAVLDGGVGFFTAVVAQEEVEISAYLVGITQATRRRRPFDARLFAEALGTEAEHRVLARFAAATIAGDTTTAPNNRGFEAFTQRSARAALNASRKLGIGFDEQGTQPGAFFEYPGNPLSNDTGIEVLTPRPA